MPKDPIKVGPYVEPTSVSTEVQVNLPTQVPTILSYEHKEKADGSSSDKAEVSVGVDTGNVAAKSYISQEKSTDSKGNSSSTTNIGIEANVPVYKSVKSDYIYWKFC